MSDRSRLSDSESRLLAETTWDRNVVVVAGAGTGKTTILVNRILNLLMREPNPLGVTDIIAVTFTNKAATEMKLRLRRELMRLAEQSVEAELATFRFRYHLSDTQISTRARQALEQLEKAQIGTLHSLAAHLLRLHPLESGLDPSFQEDDGSRFMETFDGVWDCWLDDELGPEGMQHDRWRSVLAGASLDDLHQLATLLANELIDLDALERQLHMSHVEGPLRDWIASAHSRATGLLASRSSDKQLKAEQMLSATVQCLSLLLEHGLTGLTSLGPEVRALLRKDAGKATSGWDKEVFQEAVIMIKLAKQLLAVDQSYFHNVIHLLRPVLTRVRDAFLRSGWISFDGLLARAKRLLRDCPTVRERIKCTYRAILVDEFQDTDPVQYEIILYLAERAGKQQTAWQDIDLEPGKLFIVGDPKQSIYSFRRADIEAFERVVRKILDDGGVACSLVTNFRSDMMVLDVVNDLFDRLFLPEAHVQPAHERLVMRPDRRTEVSTAGVQLRLVAPNEGEEAFDTETATRTEAETLARWISETLLASATVVDREGRSVPLQPGHIALIFRKLTQAQEYLDALRRYGIQYVTDGEKHFYRRQEIIDFVNILRVIEDPYDRIALVGVLRSPLGGVTDQSLLDLSQLNCLDYTRPERLAASKHPEALELAQLYEALRMLRQSAQLRPVPDVIDLLFDRLPVPELAASSLHGEQAVANLRKIRILAEELSDRPHMTLAGFVDVMMTRLTDQPEEAESALAEELPDAVRVLTIHKAKGLEFPVVILPGLHQGSRVPGKGPRLGHDWSSRLYGLRVGNRANLGALLVEPKISAREEAEQRRLLYVGMTRTRDLLVLSGGRTSTLGRDTVLSLIHDAIPDAATSSTAGTISLGAGQMEQVVTSTSPTVRKGPHEREASAVPCPSLDVVVNRHQTRRDYWSAQKMARRQVTPSLLMAQRVPARSAGSPDSSEMAYSRILGVCAHAVLEQWDFDSPDRDPAPAIERACRQHLAPDLADRESVLRQELYTIFSSFLTSELYNRLQRATILGREVPFLLPWEERQVMEGIIDLIYRLDGGIWIADYKTDAVSAEAAQPRAETYREQAEIYRTAVRQAMGLSSVAFQFIFLRPSMAIEM
ncbi:MAG TPA: UvrD-helicase domain-containing protein [Nitrospiraceae bacterium]|nr:UvrD-helicase domain-containing protein [Nitrospiraceae bacterium]